VNRLPLLLLAGFLLIFACQDTFTTPAGQPEVSPLVLPPVGPNFDISDAVHSAGNPHFYFLPPMVPATTYGGTFDPSLTPVVEICEWTGSECVLPLLADYSMTTGLGSETVRLVESDQHYLVNWHAGDFDLGTNTTYRIIVRASGALLGFADLDIVSNQADFKNVDTGELIPLKDGRTLVIKFRIEEGAVFVVGPGGGQVTAHDGSVALDIPEGALPGPNPVGITVVPVADDPNSAAVVPGTVFEFGSDDLGFSVPVRLSISYGELVPGQWDEESLRIHKLIGDTWEVVPFGTVDPETNTATVLINGFSSYAVLERDLTDIPESFRILYGSRRDGDVAIYVMKPGEAPEVLIDGPGYYDHLPAVSPDGEWIAFVRVPEGETDAEIYLATARGVVVGRLTDNDVTDSHPDWSPDGERLTFLRRVGGVWDVFMMPVDRPEEATNLTNHPDGDWAPDWSPLGDLIAFGSDRDGEPEIYTLTVDIPSRVQQVTYNNIADVRPDWSPTGWPMVISNDRYGSQDVTLIGFDINGAGVEYTLTHSSATDEHAQWSPDGQHIVFNSDRSGTNDIWVMNWDGSGQTNLTNDAFLNNRPTWSAYPIRPIPPPPPVDPCHSDLALTTQEEVDALSCSAVTGTLWIEGADITNLNALSSLVAVGGDLQILSNPLLTNLNGLSSLTSVGGGLWVDNNQALSDLDGLSSLTSIGGYLKITSSQNLTSIDGLASLTSLPGDLWISGTSVLPNLDGLRSLTSVGGQVSITANSGLRDVSGLSSIVSVAGVLEVIGNPQLTGCVCGLFALLQDGGVQSGVVTIGQNGTGCDHELEILEQVGEFHECRCEKIVEDMNLYMAEEPTSADLLGVVVERVTLAWEELQQVPPRRETALAIFEGPVGWLEDEVVWDPHTLPIEKPTEVGLPQFLWRLTDLAEDIAGLAIWEAVQHFGTQSLIDEADRHQNLGWAFWWEGDFQTAVVHYRMAAGFAEGSWR